MCLKDQDLNSNVNKNYSTPTHTDITINDSILKKLNDISTAKINTIQNTNDDIESKNNKNNN